MFGTYSFAAEDGENATWAMTPCAENPRDASGSPRPERQANPLGRRCALVGGSLILVVEQPDAILCEDGSSVPGVNTYSWDGATLSGNASILTNGACGPSPVCPFRSG